MRMSEFLTEEQLDEIDWNQLGHRAAGIARRVGQVGGAVAGGIHGAIDAGRQTYEPARAAVSGQGAVPPDFSRVNPALNPQQQNQLKQGVPANKVYTVLSPEQLTQVNQALMAAQQARRGSYAPPQGGQQQGAPQPSAPPPSAQQQSSAPTGGKRSGGPDGKKAIDNAIAAINSVRPDRRANVIQYAKDRVNKL